MPLLRHWLASQWRRPSNRLEDAHDTIKRMNFGVVFNRSVWSKSPGIKLQIRLGARALSKLPFPFNKCRTSVQPSHISPPQDRVSRITGYHCCTHGTREVAEQNGIDRCLCCVRHYCHQSENDKIHQTLQAIVTITTISERRDGAA
jgi:hypothetical protein